MPTFKMRIDVYVHTDTGDARAPVLDEILARLGALEAHGVTVMAKVKDLQDGVDKANAALDAMPNELADIQTKLDAEAATIAALKAQIGNGSGVSESDLDPILSNINALSQRIGVVSQSMAALGTPDGGATTPAAAADTSAPANATTGSSPAPAAEGVD